ncbi:MAG TPA: hypothetical protein PKA16_04965 [Ottowia sp.]|uniref:hypothetical protein n=1 Tax=Ottowia sp. TaxID=1898956 RepID=UPI002C3C71CA|nr:hypothetical protein [Ottowia sp.]HMN20724.1 hypothetical protein [Ottowia sp.]
MAAPRGLDARALGVYAVAGALLLLLLLVAAALESSTVLGGVAVFSCALGWGLGWLMGRLFGGAPAWHGVALVAVPLLVELYSLAAQDAVNPGLRLAWLALLTVVAGAGAHGAWRGQATAPEPRSTED